MIEFTTITSTHSANKHFYLEKGEVKVRSGAKITKGKASKTVVKGLKEFGNTIAALTDKQCLTLGTFPVDECEVVVTGKENPIEGKYGRNKANITYPQGYRIQLLDIDEVREGLEFRTAEEVYDHLCDLDLMFSVCEMLIIPSSSCGVKYKGELVKGYSWHVYITVSPDVSDKTLSEWLKFVSYENGDGRVKFSVTGKPTPVSLFDTSVFAPERVIYEARSTIDDGIEREEFEPFYQDGVAFELSDVVSVGDYSQIERELLNADGVESKSKALRDVYIARKVERALEKGLSESEAIKAATKQSDNILMMNTVIELANGDNVLVSEMCSQHEKYDGMAIPDPIEGRDYGSTTAKFWWNEGVPKINSFAHGEETVYHIMDDAGDIVMLFEELDDDFEERLDERAGGSAGGEIIDCEFEVIGEAVKPKKKVAVSAHKGLGELVASVTCKNDINKILSVAVKMNLSSLDVEALATEICKKLKSVGITSYTPTSIKKEYKTLKNKHKDKTFGNDGDFINDYVYLTADGIFHNKITGEEMGHRAFNMKHDRETPIDGDTPVNAETYAKARVKCVSNTMYVPKFGQFFKHGGVEYYNTYKAPKRKYVAVGTTDICKRVVEHTAMLLPNKKDQEVLLSFIAHQVQNTGQLLYWAVVLQGDQGTGKSFYADMLTEMLGANNVGRVSSSMLMSGYNGFTVGKAVNCVDELRVDDGKDRYKAVNIIKPLITDTVLAISEKYKTAMSALNTCNYFCTTNDKDALPMNETDRRWAVLFGNNKLAELGKTTSYFKFLFNDMRNNIDELYQFFKEYPIPDHIKNAVRAPETTAKQLMINASKPLGVIAVEEAFEDFPDIWLDDARTELNITRLQELGELHGGHVGEFPKSNHLRHILMDMGFHREGRAKVSGHKVTVYKKMQ